MASTTRIRHVLLGTEAKLPDGRPAYSAAVIAGGTIHLAGVTSGRDANGVVVGRGDITAQTVAVFEGMKRVLEASGATFADLTKITVYATKLEHRQRIAEVRQRYLQQPPPASTFVVIGGLADPDFLVEIEATALAGA